jgi:hypothetical protein
MSENEKIRLLICDSCNTIQEVPAYTGNPDNDYLMQYRVAEHQFPSGTFHKLEIGRVDKDDWDRPEVRTQVSKELAYAANPGLGMGLGESFYDVKSTFQEDAMSCWKSWNKPKDSGHCDFRRDNKRLYPDTKHERKEEGLDTGARPNIFLCDMCPVQSMVDQKKRKAKKLYD